MRRKALIEIAERKFDAAIAALDPIEGMPCRRSPHIGRPCETTGLRSRRVTSLPKQWLYFDAEDDFDVVGLLGDRQDIVVILSAEEWLAGSAAADAPKDGSTASSLR